MGQNPNVYEDYEKSAAEKRRLTAAIGSDFIFIQLLMGKLVIYHNC